MLNFPRKFTVGVVVVALLLGLGPASFYIEQFGAASAATPKVDVEKAMKERLELASKVARGVRTFGSSNGLELVPCLARDRGFSVIAAGAYLNGDPKNDSEQINALRENAIKGCVTVAVLGTNPTANGRSVTQVTQEINAFKKSLADKGITNVQVTTAERYEMYRDNPTLTQAVDVIFVSMQPFFEGPSTGVNSPLSPNDSFVRVRAAYDWLADRYPDKVIVISESGWPTAGPDTRSTNENAASYLSSLVRWTAENKIPMFAYSLMDEPDLAKFNGNLSHFGIFDQNSKLKPGMQNVFSTNCVPVGSQRVTLNPLTSVNSMTCFTGVNFVAPTIPVQSVPTTSPATPTTVCQLTDVDMLNVLRRKAVGITNANLSKIPVDLSGATGKDSDGDGLPDVIESSLGTNPIVADTDQDGYSDRSEVEYGYSPLKGNKARASYDLNFAKSQRGRAFLQVQSKGEGWYVSTKDARRSYFLTSPEARNWACK